MGSTGMEQPARVRLPHSAFSSSTETESVSGSQSIRQERSLTFDVPIPPGPYEVAADCTAKFLTDTGVEVRGSSS